MLELVFFLQLNHKSHTHKTRMEHISELCQIEWFISIPFIRCIHVCVCVCDAFHIFQVNHYDFIIIMVHRIHKYLQNVN